MDCVQPSRQKTSISKCLRISDYFKHQVAIKNGPWHRSPHTSRHPQHAHYTEKAQARWAGHVTRMPDDRLPKQLGELCHENDKLVGKRNASRTPLRRPSQASTLMSPTGKSMPRNDPCDAVWFIPEQEQQKQTGSRRLRKSALNVRKARHYSVPPAPQPALHTHAPSVEECCRPELDHLRTHKVNQTWHHHHNEEVMVIIGNDGPTTCLDRPTVCRCDYNFLRGVGSGRVVIFRG